MTEPIPIVTSSWHTINDGRTGKNPDAEGFVAVRTSVGRPRWWDWTEGVLWIKELTPFGIFNPEQPLPEDEYRELYVARLERFGVERIERRLAEVHAEYERPLALLCFCNLAKGWCHRTMFSAWWERQTGQEVPEL